ncbi:SAVMC3_10250 family protein [Streptomyces viridochromogenes]|uniref:SAVMC3_10250 family protein n=1 Tax=Streptomyces viridochromogenes TaxID=1938 RepID=UPI0034DD93DB
MRELIYLSDRKLSQFVDTGGNGRRRRVNQLGATAPMGLGGFQVGLSESMSVEHSRLAEVIRHLEKTAAPQPFTDEDLRPGQWVRFSADMIYQIFRDPEGIARRPRADHPGPPHYCSGTLSHPTEMMCGQPGCCCMDPRSTSSALARTRRRLSPLVTSRQCLRRLAWSTSSPV